MLQKYAEAARVGRIFRGDYRFAGRVNKVVADLMSLY
jgi:hypothetical protein